MAPPHKVEVLRIPADKSPITLETTDTITHHYNSGHTLGVKTVSLEESLGHVPNLERFSGRINPSHRCLFNRDISATAAPRKMNRWMEEYYIYKCIEETTAKLPENKYFKKDQNARVYGDAFIFRVRQVKSFHGQWMAVFGDMEEFAISLDKADWALDYMHRMAEW